MNTFFPKRLVSLWREKRQRRILRNKVMKDLPLSAQYLEIPRCASGHVAGRNVVSRQRLVNSLICLSLFNATGCTSTPKKPVVSTLKPVAAIPRIANQAAFDRIAKPVSDKISFAWFCKTTSPEKIKSYFINSQHFESPFAFAQKYLRTFDGFSINDFTEMLEDDLDDRIACGSLIRYQKNISSPPTWIATSLKVSSQHTDDIQQTIKHLSQKTFIARDQLAYGFTDQKSFDSGKLMALANGIVPLNLFEIWPPDKTDYLSNSESIWGFLSEQNDLLIPETSGSVIISPTLPQKTNPLASYLIETPPHPISLKGLRMREINEPKIMVGNLSKKNIEENRGRLIKIERQENYLTVARLEKSPANQTATENNMIYDHFWRRPQLLSSNLIREEAFGTQIASLKKAHQTLNGLPVNLQGVALPFRYYQETLSTSVSIGQCEKAAVNCSLSRKKFCKRAAAICYQTAGGKSPSILSLINSISSESSRKEWYQNVELLDASLAVVRDAIRSSKIKPDLLEQITAAQNFNLERKPKIIFSFEGTDLGHQHVTAALSLKRIVCPAKNKIPNHNCLGKNFRQKLLSHANSSPGNTDTAVQRYYAELRDQLVSASSIEEILLESYANVWSLEEFLKRERLGISQQSPAVSTALITFPAAPSSTVRTKIRSLGPRQGFELAIAAQLAPIDPSQPENMGAAPEKLLVKADEFGKILGFRRIRYSNQSFPAKAILKRGEIARIVNATIALYTKSKGGTNEANRSSFQAIVSEDESIIYIPKFAH